MRKGREGVGSEQGGKREGVCQQQGLQSAVIFMPSIYYQQHKKFTTHTCAQLQYICNALKDCVQ